MVEQWQTEDTFSDIHWYHAWITLAPPSSSYPALFAQRNAVAPAFSDTLFSNTGADGTTATYIHAHQNNEQISMRQG